MTKTQKHLLYDGRIVLLYDGQIVLLGVVVLKQQITGIANGSAGYYTDVVAPGTLSGIDNR